MIHRPAFLFASLILATGPALAAGPGAAPSAAPSAAYIARVNGVDISADQLGAALTQARAAGQQDSPELRRVLAQRLITEELFWQEAKKQKLDRTKESSAAADQARRSAAIRQYLRVAVKVAEPTDAEVRQRYQDIVASLGTHEYRLSLIQTADEVTLRDAAGHIAEGTDFASEARRISQAPSAARGGELDWVSFPLPPTAGRTNGLPLAIAEAALQLSPGQVSAPVRIGDTWALIRLDARRPTLVPSFEQVASTVRQSARAKAVDEAARALTREVLGKARIEFPAENAATMEPRQ